MLINQANLTALYQSVQTIFNKAFTEAKPEYDRIAMVVPSGTRENAYSWLGALPKLREWIGDRQHKNLTLHDYTIKNKDWEATVDVDRNDIEDDQYGVLSPLFSEIGRSAAMHPDEIVFALIALGLTTVCYDGQYFFDTDHPVGDSTASNYGGGSSTLWTLLDVSRAIKPFVFQSRRDIQFVRKDQPSDDNVFEKKVYSYGVDRRDNAGFGLWQFAYASKDTLNAANYAAARAAMMAFTDDEGKPISIVPNLLVVPPSLESAARILLKNQNDAAGATNPWFGTAELIISPWLS
jgi:phage major head subunit gpT-like protein